MHQMAMMAPLLPLDHSAKEWSEGGYLRSRVSGAASAWVGRVFCFVCMMLLPRMCCSVSSYVHLYFVQRTAYSVIVIVGGVSISSVNMLNQHLCFFRLSTSAFS